MLRKISYRSGATGSATRSDFHLTCRSKDSGKFIAVNNVTVDFLDLASLLRSTAVSEANPTAVEQSLDTIHNLHAVNGGIVDDGLMASSFTGAAPYWIFRIVVIPSHFQHRIGLTTIVGGIDWSMHRLCVFRTATCV